MKDVGGKEGKVMYPSSYLSEESKSFTLLD